MSGTNNITGYSGGRGEPKTGTDYGNTVFTNKKDNSTLDQSDFMKLMVAQMQNQDFMNPMDDSQMVDQMVQFSNMQQMQEMTSYSRSNYAMSMVGKTVTASRFTVGGDLDTATGAVQRISLVDNEYVMFVDGKKFQMSEIMSIGSGSAEGISAVDPSKISITVDPSGIKYDCASIAWKVPTEDEMTAKELKYNVFYTKIDSDKADADKTEDEKKLEAFDTVEAVEKGTRAGTADKKNLTSQDLISLDPDTQYRVNVVITDGNGIKTIYKPATFRTKLLGQ